MGIAESIDVIRRAYEAGPFQQTHLLTEASFLSYVQNRAIPVYGEELEQLKEVLFPVDRLSDDEELYHPYQVWVIHQRISRLPQVRWSSWRTLSRERVVEIVEQADNHAAAILGGFRTTVEEFYAILALISLAEPVYLPLVRGRLSLRQGDTRDYARWRSNFDVMGILDKCQVGPDQIRTWHERLAMEAWAIDPAPEWFPLIRHARFDRRDRLKGNLRLAHDYYEKAEILRLLYRRVTGEDLLPENEYGTIPWTSGAHKASEAPVLERVALKRVVRGFGLDAGYRGYWFVEGDTEEGFYQELSRLVGINLEEAGIALVNLGGGGEIAGIRTEVKRRFSSDAFVEQLQTYRSDEIFVYFVVDDDDSIREGLEKLALPVFVWVEV